ncbi:MAG: hypothetical protein RBG13Loki_1238 [Promethearchaeota archaeon CR_4]|nr:MAG: hypothetical protein RBG13Loki_1238 [Candidatus Lokiarchaeota archaeon CR_4]
MMIQCPYCKSSFQNEVALNAHLADPKGSHFAFLHGWSSDVDSKDRQIYEILREATKKRGRVRRLSARLASPK